MSETTRLCGQIAETQTLLRQLEDARRQLTEMRRRYNALAVQFAIVEQERDHYRNAWLEDVAMLKRAGRSE